MCFLLHLFRVLLWFGISSIFDKMLNFHIKVRTLILSDLKDGEKGWSTDAMQTVQKDVKGIRVFWRETTGPCERKLHTL